jgi:hypothetical protein
VEGRLSIAGGLVPFGRYVTKLPRSSLGGGDGLGVKEEASTVQVDWLEETSTHAHDGASDQVDGRLKYSYKGIHISYSPIHLASYALSETTSQCSQCAVCTASAN